jgi:threonylcarbamoyladenosine tRNA methylthiotransferase MtaB
MEQDFSHLGCTVVPWKQKADLYVVNTCTVTARAAYQSRQIIRRLRRQSPGARIIATGCLVQTDAPAILESAGPGICMAGNEQKEFLARNALAHRGCTGIFISDISNVKRIGNLFLQRRPEERTRAYLRIQDGCDAFCSYCIVPYARGRSRSLEPAMVMKQMEVFSEAGVKEVVITGIHVGFYGRDLSQDTDILGLLKELCSSFPHISFRLSSIEPTEVSKEMVKWAAETENFCPHFHIPLQSGSDRVLSAMNRNYSSSFFRDLLEFISESIPGCCMGTDVMTGFPSEHERDFQETAALIEKAPVSYLHAFPFSPRPGTVAAAMKPVCGAREARERAKFLRMLGERKKRAFYRSFLGKKLDVLVERKDPKTGLFVGHTPNYIPVLLDSSLELKNKRVMAEAMEIGPMGVMGRLC